MLTPHNYRACERMYVQYAVTDPLYAHHLTVNHIIGPRNPEPEIVLAPVLNPIIPAEVVPAVDLPSSSINENTPDDNAFLEPPLVNEYPEASPVSSFVFNMPLQKEPSQSSSAGLFLDPYDSQMSS